MDAVSNVESPVTFTKAEKMLIVPRAHTALGDTWFQVEMYELFHCTWVGRFGHIVGTPMILFGVAGALSRTGWGVGVFALIALAMVMFATRVDRVVALVNAALLVATWFAAAATIGTMQSHALTLVAALIGIGCLVQTMSHAAEDIPPPHSGTDRFVPVREWLRSVGIGELAHSTKMIVLCFYWLELWATFRIWPLQVLQVMTLLGYRPTLRARLDARCAEIKAAPTQPWRNPSHLPAHDAR